MELPKTKEPMFDVFWKALAVTERVLPSTYVLLLPLVYDMGSANGSQVNLFYTGAIYICTRLAVQALSFLAKQDTQILTGKAVRLTTSITKICDAVLEAEGIPKQVSRCISILKWISVSAVSERQVVLPNVLYSIDECRVICKELLKRRIQFQVLEHLSRKAMIVISALESVFLIDSKMTGHTGVDLTLKNVISKIVDPLIEDSFSIWKTIAIEDSANLWISLDTERKSWTSIDTSIEDILDDRSI